MISQPTASGYKMPPAIDQPMFLKQYVAVQRSMNLPEQFEI